MRSFRISKDRWFKKKKKKEVVFIMASYDSLSPSASALLLLNFHVFVYMLQLYIVHFILLEQYTVIKI